MSLLTHLNPNAIEDASIEGIKLKDGSITSSKIDSSVASKKYVDDTIASAISASDAMVFKGTIGTGGTSESLPSTAIVGDTYKVIALTTIPSASSYTGAEETAKVGDLIVAISAEPKWIVVPSGDDEIKTLIQSITWSDLKAKRDAGSLIPGMQYRITDYVCTTTQTDTKSAGHQFDIIVVADDERTLNETARAIKHPVAEGETDYFANNDLSVWQIWYCLDNDTARFTWADSSANGKGVIYRMIDEWNNDVPYDFKNIQFARNWSTIAPNSGLTGTIYCYTFSEFIEGFGEDTTASDESVKAKESIESDETGSFGNNVIRTRQSSGICSLNDIIFVTDRVIERGEHYGNSFGNNCYNNTFGGSCHSNTFGNNCYSNTFDSDCCGNKFADNCHNNTFGSGCHGNKFEDNCYNNKFGASCSYNTFGSDCYDNTFDSDCHGNTLRDNCNNNTFGTSCGYNTFGNYCQYNTFGYDYRNNVFGNDCARNTFGPDCYENTFGNGCCSNTFGSGCQYIKFASNKEATTKYTHYRNNRFGDECKHIVFKGAETASSNSQVQNYNFAYRLQGTHATYLTIDGVRNRTFETKVAQNSNGELKIYCEADLIR